MLIRKEFVLAVLAQYGFHFSGRLDAYDDLYQQIGEKLCKELFTNGTGKLALPTADQAMAERNALIENLA